MYFFSYISQMIQCVPFMVTSTNFHGFVFQLALKFAKINICGAG